jgi:hypothetical protein
MISIRLVGPIVFLLSGLLYIAFWASAVPLKSFVGADASLSQLWIPSQTLHILAAITGLLGTAGVHGHHSAQTGPWGLLGSTVSLVGQACFFADGVIAYAVFPAIAVSDRKALDIDGFMFTGANYAAYTAFAILFMFGYIILGIALLAYRRCGALPPAPLPGMAEIATCALILGAILSHLPPTAGFNVICAGGIVWGVGACVLGFLWARASWIDRRTPAASFKTDVVQP